MKALIDNTGWLCIALAIAAAGVGIALRRMRSAPPILVRMRPHFWLGYASFILASYHMWTTFPIMGVIRGPDYANGLDAATIALVALAVQVGIGWWLRTPGKYRAVLRVIHYVIIAVLVVTIAVHIRAQS